MAKLSRETFAKLIKRPFTLVSIVAAIVTLIVGLPAAIGVVKGWFPPEKPPEEGLVSFQNGLQILAFDGCKQGPSSTKCEFRVKAREASPIVITHESRLFASNGDEYEIHDAVVGSDTQPVTLAEPAEFLLKGGLQYLLSMTFKTSGKEFAVQRIHVSGFLEDGERIDFSISP